MKRLLALVSVTLLLALLAGGAPTLAQDDGQAARFGAAVYAEFYRRATARAARQSRKALRSRRSRSMRRWRAR